MKPNCTIYYRTHAGENKAPRPSWYSKPLCLSSIVRAIEYAKNDFRIKFVLLHDGLLSENLGWTLAIQHTIAKIEGDIVEMQKTNNSRSFLQAFHKALELNDEEIVFFAEDDYLWLEASIRAMAFALLQLPAHYVTGYDHPVRYQPDYPLGADWPHWDNNIYITGDRHWRTQESTCMTFAAKVSTLREDLKYFEKYSDNGKGYPNDRELFRHLGGLGDYGLGESPRRLLIGPIPSLNTHVHLPWLAPIVNWNQFLPLE